EVAFELIPADVGGVVIFNQHIPFIHRLVHATTNALATIHHGDQARRASVRISASVNWIDEDVVYDVVSRQAPHNAVCLTPARFGGQFDPFVSEPDMHLPHTLEFGEFCEDELNRLLHASVRTLLDPASPDFYIARRPIDNQCPAACHLAQGRLRALTEQRQFEFAHRPLHAEKQTVVGRAWIVDAVLVDEDGADQSTKLDECVPVATVASETRSLDRDPRAHTPGTDGRQQSLEAWTRNSSARSSEIVVDDLGNRPA